MGPAKREHVPDPTPTPNVVLYLIDTLRADHLGAWGNPYGLTPTMDRLATEGVQFALATSTSAWTKPAIPSLLSATHPTTHLVGTRNYADRLPESVETLQDRFAQAGWRAGSFSSSPLGSTLSGLERGFDLAVPPTYWRGQLSDLGHPSSDQLHTQLAAFHEESGDAPFFAYVHTLEPHGWKRPRYATPKLGWTSYEAAVAEQDALLGDLVAWLEAEGIAENTLLVIVSDHGESFGDHGVHDHGSGLFQSQAHVPLLFWAGRGLPPMTVTDPVSLVDVAPTILDLVGLPPLEGVPGRSLRPYVDGADLDRPIDDFVFAERLRYVWSPDEAPIHAVLAANGEKFVRQGDTALSFDLTADLCEARTSTRRSRPLVARLDAFLAAEEVSARQFAEDHPLSDSTATDAEVDALRALGYLD